MVLTDLELDDAFSALRYFLSFDQVGPEWLRLRAGQVYTVSSLHHRMSKLCARKITGQVWMIGHRNLGTHACKWKSF